MRAELIKDRMNNFVRTSCYTNSGWEAGCYMLTAGPKTKSEWLDIYADIIAANVDCLDNEKAAKSVIEEYMWSMKFCDANSNYIEAPETYNMKALLVSARLRQATRDLISNRLQEITTVLI